MNCSSAGQARRVMAARLLFATAAALLLTAGLAPVALAGPARARQLPASRQQARVAAATRTRQAAAPLLQSNWFWYHETAAAPVTISDSQDPTPSEVPAGDVAIAYTHGAAGASDAPSKETYLAFNLSALPAGALLAGFSFTLALDHTDPQASALNQAAGAVPLVACLPLLDWSNGAGTDYATKPTDDCSHAVAGQWNKAATAVSFDVASYAQQWLSAVNYGLAVRERPGYDQPFQLDFARPDSLTATASYHLPSTASAHRGARVTSGGTTPASAPPGGATSTGAVPSGSVPLVALPSPVTSPAALPSSATPPVPAVVATGGTPARRAAGSAVHLVAAGSGLTWADLAGLVVLAGVLLTASLWLGAPAGARGRVHSRLSSLAEAGQRPVSGGAA